MRQKLPAFAEDCSSNPSLTTREATHLPAKECYSVKNIACTVSNKSIELQTSDYFPPLIVMDYTETKRVFASHRRPKGASGGRQLVQCSTLSEPFPTACIREGMSDHTSPSICSWLSSHLVTCVYQYLHGPDFYHKGSFATLGLLECHSVSEGVCINTKTCL